MSEFPPVPQAVSDYWQGGGFNDNPYYKNTPDYRKYEAEMHRLFAQELKATRDEMGVKI
jgi:hypothetical protein